MSPIEGPIKRLYSQLADQPDGFTTHMALMSSGQKRAANAEIPLDVILDGPLC